MDFSDCLPPSCVTNPSVAGTTTDSGIPVEHWWQSDIDAEVGAAPNAIKWSYQEMLAGVETMRFLIQGTGDGRYATGICS
jgi:hypothetical protein